MNRFIDATFTKNTFTENGAISHSSTKSIVLDYFTKSATYRDRSLADVYADISAAWGESPELALKVIFFNRMITRKAKSFDDSVTEKVQRGQGAKDEFRKALGWVAKYHPETWAKNSWLIPVVGCWKDLWHEDVIDIFNHDVIYVLIEEGLKSQAMSGLIVKYLPRIRSANKVKTDYHRKLNYFARGLCKHLQLTEQEYRKLKSDPDFTAHQFQRDMCANRWDSIDFKSISGKALFNLLTLHGRDGKSALERHNQLPRYENWIAKQPVAKFTGYVYELYKKTTSGMKFAQKVTLDKQFDGLLELAKKDSGGIKGNVWCALDTSGSMRSQVAPNLTAYDVCISLGVYFSSLNTGAFKDNVIMFDDHSRVMKLSGSFTDKVLQVQAKQTAWGSTNFQSVINEIVRIRKNNPDIPVSDFPTTLLVVSDMQFNPVGGNVQTNYEAAMAKLAAVGLPKMQIIWWFVTGRGQDFPNQLTDEGVSMLGGFDGSTVELVLGGEGTTVDPATGEKKKPNPWESMMLVLNQEVLQNVKV